MSSVSFSTGSKTENGVYLAFGVVVALSAIRLFSPQILENPPVALAVVAFWGSVVASMAFLIRIDRVVTWLVRWATLRRYGANLRNQILTADIVLPVWELASTDVWHLPDEKAGNMLSQILEGPDSREDIWTLKGAFYFAVSLPLLFYAASMISLETYSLMLVLEVATILVALYDFRGFLKRCASLAAFRYLSETRSVVQLRRKHKEGLGNTTAGAPFTNEIVDDVLDDLESMIVRRDWKGFNRRLGYLLEDFEGELKSSESGLSKEYVKSWARAVMAGSEENRKRELVRVRVMKRVLTHATAVGCVSASLEGLSELLKPEDDKLGNPLLLFSAVDSAGMRRDFSDPMFSAFYTLSHPPVDKSLVEIVLKWYRNSRSEFAEGLLRAAEHVDEDLRGRIIQELIGQNAPEDIWRQIQVSSVVTLINYPGGGKSRFLLSALRGGNRNVIYQILKDARTDDYELVKEVMSYLGHSDQSLVMQAVLFFFRVDTAMMNQFLLYLLKDEEPVTRLSAARFLGRVFTVEKSLVTTEFEAKRKAYRPALSTALTNDNPGVRKAAVAAVEELELNDSEVKALQLLADSDPDNDVRFAARRVLGLRER